MNKLTIVLALLAFGCGPASNSNQTSNTDASVETPVVADAMVNSEELSAKTAVRKEPATPTDDSLPRQIDDYTAISPVYSINSPNCQNRDDEANEGDKYARKCRGYGTYSLWATGDDEHITYSIDADDPERSSSALLLPLDAGEASAYVRSDQFTHKLDDRIEWCLDSLGTPHAVIVRAYFYKNIGTPKESIRAANKAAEFYLVRGLGRYQDLQVDIPTTNTPYNPIEHARVTASRYYDGHPR